MRWSLIILDLTQGIEFMRKIRLADIVSTKTNDSGGKTDIAACCRPQ